MGKIKFFFHVGMNFLFCVRSALELYNDDNGVAALRVSGFEIGHLREFCSLKELFDGGFSLRKLNENGFDFEELTEVHLKVYYSCTT